MARRSGSGNGAMTRRRASTFEHTEAQNAVYAAPWILLVLAAVAGQILHTLYATESSLSGLVVVGVVLGTAALSWAGWVSTHDRSRASLTHTLVTIVVSGAWMIVCAVTGMISFERVDGVPIPLPLVQRPTLDLWVIVGGVLCIMWNFRQGVRVNEARAAAQAGDVVDEWTEAGVPGVKGRFKRVNRFRSEGTLTLPKGVYLEILQKNARGIESAFDWPPNSLTLLPMPRAGSRKIRARVMHENPLEGKVEWPGVDA